MIKNKLIIYVKREGENSFLFVPDVRTNVISLRLSSNFTVTIIFSLYVIVFH